MIESLFSEFLQTRKWLYLRLRMTKNREKGGDWKENPPPQFNFYLFTKMKDHHLSYYIVPPSS